MEIEDVLLEHTYEACKQVSMIAIFFMTLGVEYMSGHQLESLVSIEGLPV